MPASESEIIAPAVARASCTVRSSCISARCRFSSDAVAVNGDEQLAELLARTDIDAVVVVLPVQAMRTVGTLRRDCRPLWAAEAHCMASIPKP